MSRLEKLIQELCPDGVEFLRLGDCCVLQKGRTPIQKAIPGEYPLVVTTSERKSSNSYQFNEPTVCIPLVSSRGHGVASLNQIYYQEGKFALGNILCGVSPIDDRLSAKFLFYYLNHMKDILLVPLMRGGANVSLTVDSLERVFVPVPPMSVQNEIISVLDSFEEYRRLLSTELTARKRQYEYYRDELLTFGDDVEWKPLGELFPFIRNGYVGPIKEYFTDAEHGVRYLEGTNIHNGVISDNEVLYVTKEFHEKHIKNKLKPDDILMVQSGHIGECAVVGKKYEGANCHALIIMSNGGFCNSKFYSHYFHSYKGFNSLTPAMTGGTVKHVLATRMKNIIVPVPLITVQNEIVKILDNLENLCLDISFGIPAEIEARTKQYEYYRDKLLTFKRKEVV